jgi:hypothetical protein
MIIEVSSRLTGSSSSSSINYFASVNATHTHTHTHTQNKREGKNGMRITQENSSFYPADKRKDRPFLYYALDKTAIE